MTTVGDLPESLRKLIQVWREAGASRQEIVDSLDQLELLALEERASLVELTDSLAANPS